MPDPWEDPEHPVILGEVGQATFYVQDAAGDWHGFDHYEYFRVKKSMNQISEFEIKIYDIQDAEKVYFKERATCIFLVDNVVLLKGRIQNISYGTVYECTAKGFGMEAGLIDKELTEKSNTSAVWSTNKKCSFTNISAATIAKEVLSTNTDGITPWIIQPATDGIFASDFGLITLVFENVNRLKAINTICDATTGTSTSSNFDSTKYEWWVDIDRTGEPIDYDTDYFHIGELRPSTTRATTPQYTFNITGVDENCSNTQKEKDISNLVNYITVLGSGDGTSQISTSTYAASDVFSVLSADILSTSNTIGLADASSFPASGEIRIAEERITYSGKSGNNLTGCTRGANSTIARPHMNNIYVEVYYAVDSPAANSPISTYGLMDYTYTDKGLIDREVMEVMASNTLLERKTPIIRIKVTPDEPPTIASTLDIGDSVTVVDSESAINGNYRIQTIEYRSDYGFLSCDLELSNKSLTFVEQMQKNKDVTDSLNKFSQGSSIMNIQGVENLDSTNDMNLRFYMPSDVINVSEGLLSFKVKSYRTEVTGATTGNESATHTHTDSGHTHGAGTLAADDDDGTHVHSDSHSHGIGTIDASWEDAIGTTTAIGSTGGTSITSTGSGHSHDVDGTTATGTASLGNESATHTHAVTVTYGIHEVATSSPYVGVLEGAAGSEVCISTLIDSGTAESGGNTTLTDTDKSWVVNTHAHKMVHITAGTGAGQARIITSNTATELTVPTWDTNPSSDSVYKIYDTFSSDQTSIDIKDSLVTGGIGTWQNIRFVGDQPMRVEANAYIRLFV